MYSSGSGIKKKKLKKKKKKKNRLGTSINDGMNLTVMDTTEYYEGDSVSRASQQSQTFRQPK